MLPYLKLTEENIAKGYGKFPYLIVREYDIAVYVQIPIQVIPNNNYDGTIKTEVAINGIVKFFVPPNQVTDKEYIHERFEAFLKAYSRHQKLRCYLVVSKNKSYWSEGDEFVELDIIPCEGVLQDFNKNWLGWNTRHYLESS